ncbi:MAG: hypothetical protein N2321_11995 [Melioribacteraceae bacterium]|nr:hypothetical protein [Melioribacteraceae bacterium]
MIKQKNIPLNKKKIKTIIFNDFWINKNYYLLFVAIIVLILGYYLMSFEPWDNFISLNISPLVLLFSYVIIIPLSIFLRFKKKEDDFRNS